MIPPEELVAELRELGLEAEADLSGLRLWVPITGILQRWLVRVALGSPLLLVLACGLGQPLPLLAEVLAVLAVSGLVVGALGLLGLTLLSLAMLPLPLLRRVLGQRLVLSPQVLRVGRQHIPLEELAAFSVERGRLVVVRSSGARAVLLWSDRPELLRVIQRLILHQKQARMRLLQAEGHDLSVEAQIPPEILRLGRPIR